MKTLSLESVRAARELKNATNGGYILLTFRGKPVAYLLPTSLYDEEDIGYMTDPEFWKSVAEWRKSKGPVVPLEQMMARIGKNHGSRKKGSKNGSSRSK